MVKKSEGSVTPIKPELMSLKIYVILFVVAEIENFVHNAFYILMGHYIGSRLKCLQFSLAIFLIICNILYFTKQFIRIILHSCQWLEWAERCCFVFTTRQTLQCYKSRLFSVQWHCNKVDILVQIYAYLFLI